MISNEIHRGDPMRNADVKKWAKCSIRGDYTDPDFGPWKDFMNGNLIGRGIKAFEECYEVVRVDFVDRTHDGWITLILRQGQVADLMDPAEYGSDVFYTSIPDRQDPRLISGPPTPAPEPDRYCVLGQSSECDLCLFEYDTEAGVEQRYVLLNARKGTAEYAASREDLGHVEMKWEREPIISTFTDYKGINERKDAV